MIDYFSFKVKCVVLREIMFVCCNTVSHPASDKNTKRESSPSAVKSKSNMSFNSSKVLYVLYPTYVVVVVCRVKF